MSIDIKEKFLELTSKTYPHGTEELLENQLPKGIKKDDFNNYFIEIGKNNSVMFTCHLDTACKYHKKVNHRFRKKGKIIGTDGSTILGADDKAGMVVLLKMIENKVPGLYYFFIGEEVGCIGSGDLALFWEEFEYSHRINKIISFDRRGTNSIITHQMMGRSASDEFGQELANRLNSVNGLSMKLDNTGVLTDSASFMDQVEECTNISVGYMNEHTTNETQNIYFLEKLCEACVNIKWEDLPVKRDINDFSWGAYARYEDEEEELDNWSIEYYSYFNIDDKVKKMYISKSKIKEEKGLIIDWLKMSGSYAGFDPKTVVWNGERLRVKINNSTVDVGTRYELMEIITQLSEVERCELREKI
jgi:hypothetical protein